MVDKLKVAVISAVRAYMETEDKSGERSANQVLNGWKMGGRREIMGRFNLPRRGNSSIVRLRGYSFL